MEESPFDLDYMLDLAEKMAETQLALSKSKHAETLFKAEIAQRVTENDKYWVNGKVPSMAYINSHYHVLGFDEDSGKSLYNLAEKIIELESELLRLRTKYNIERDKLEVWRTISANNRNAISFAGN